MFNASLGAQPFDLRVVQSNDLDTHVCVGQDNRGSGATYLLITDISFIQFLVKTSTCNVFIGGGIKQVFSPHPIASPSHKEILLT